MGKGVSLQQKSFRGRNEFPPMGRSFHARKKGFHVRREFPTRLRVMPCKGKSDSLPKRGVHAGKKVSQGRKHGSVEGKEFPCTERIALKGKEFPCQKRGLLWIECYPSMEFC